MKTLWWATAALLLLGFVCTGTARAQRIASSGDWSPATVRQIASQTKDSGAASADAPPAPASSSPSNKPATDQGTAAPESSKAEEAPAEEEKPTCRFCTAGKLGDPWTLPQPCFLKEHGIEVHGWASSGIYGNNYGDPSNGPLGFNNFSDFNLNQLTVYAEKKTNTEEKGWDIGGRIEYMYGTDAVKTQAFGDQGWDYGWNSSSRYGSAIPQMYAEFAFDDWSIKAGRFYTPIGYEVVPATGNFFYSHSYTCFYAEPFTHTGFIATKKVNDKLSVFGGWVDGWDSGWDNRNGADNFIGGATLTMSEKATLAWTMTAGNWGAGRDFNGTALSTGDIYMNSLVLTLKITDKWTYVLQHDLGINSNLATANTSWYGINQELFYKINDCWSAGGRMEWFRDDDGVRVVAGNAGNYYEATMGLNFKPHSNLMLRPELRWDWYEGSVATATSHPFNDGQSNNQFSAGFDMILTF